MVKHGRVDANQKEVVEAFRGFGWYVQILSDVGGGVPDLIMGKNGVNVFVEIKDGKKAKLTPAQVIWHKEWKGQVAIVRDMCDVIKLNNSY